jgi:hypothetical protein
MLPALEYTMFEIAKITPLRTVELPPSIAEQFGPNERFIVWVEGDTVHLKRIVTSPLDAVEHAPLEAPMSLDELDEVVHEVRRQRHPRPVD